MKDQEQIHKAAQRSEILAVLKRHGPCHPGYISRITGFPAHECRDILETMKNNGEIGYSFVKGYSV